MDMALLRLGFMPVVVRWPQMVQKQEFILSPIPTAAVEGPGGETETR